MASILASLVIVALVIAHHFADGTLQESDKPKGPKVTDKVTFFSLWMETVSGGDKAWAGSSVLDRGPLLGCRPVGTRKQELCNISKHSRPYIPISSLIPFAIAGFLRHNDRR